MKKLLFTLVIVLLITISCGNGENKPQQSIYSSIVQIDDATYQSVFISGNKTYKVTFKIDELQSVLEIMKLNESR